MHHHRITRHRHIRRVLQGGPGEHGARFFLGEVGRGAGNGAVFGIQRETHAELRGVLPFGQSGEGVGVDDDLAAFTRIAGAGGADDQAGGE